MVAVIKERLAPGKAEFHAAIARRSPAWYSACVRITRNEDLAQDAVQDALLNAWKKREQFQSSSSLETWIHRIAVNSALQLLRKNKPERCNELAFEVVDESATAHDIQSDSELESSLANCLRRLTEVERVCFVLRHLEQWRVLEIADELQVNEGRVKQALFRAVKKLRVSMSDLRSENHD
ncbi:MAG: sigma-70 family RNA polymerase sigma factor [Woeseiaceae bacterium]